MKLNLLQMNWASNFIVLFFFLCGTLNAQTKNNSNILNNMQRDRPIVGKQKGIQGRVVSMKQWKGKKQLNCELQTNDSVSIFLNDSLMFSGKNLLSRNQPSFNERLSFLSHDKSDTIIIVVHEAKRYIKFKPKKRFAFINVYFLTSDQKGTWNINYSNNIPSE